MNIIFQISGGIGKCVMATAVCEAIKIKYPDSKLIVISGYPDVFLNNPNVHRTYALGNSNYFYSEYIENQKVLVFAHDPYFDTAFVNQNEHLIKTWCEMFDIPYHNEQPKIYLTAREIKFYATKFVSDKPIFLIQTNGGAQTEHKYSWARDIPSLVVVRVIDEFKDEYNIVHIKREDQLIYNNTIPISDNYRALAVLISISEKRLFIDSFAQHTAAALKLPSTVCWIANKPEVFGYDIHSNILANEFTNKPELRNSYLQKFNISGDLLDFPYDSEDEIFNTELIIQSLKS